mmetsp:Transcript_7105/g.15517  ORF Transcript_7105/g.15517 Transcript_7105/m.15517 type:complete len:408 (-) Transcript_7105:197-1420(-)
MCGRSAQSVRGVEQAEEELRAEAYQQRSITDQTGGAAPRPHEQVSPSAQSIRPSHWPSSLDNVNMGPGMRGLVLHKGGNETSGRSGGIVCEEMVWGLVPKAGTKTSPLPTGPSQHYSNLMFNARSDTLYDKRTFRDLALRGQTCVVALDGFYEWKESEKSAIGGGSGKQPYYIHRSDGKPLLIAGLWTSVPTGRQHGYDGKPEKLTTYTLLTTDACPKLRWLHHRQPVLLWDTTSALEWLQSPSQKLEKSIANEASIDSDALTWYPVSKKMNKTQYREKDCNVAIKIEKVASVKSFFSKSFAQSAGSKARVPAQTGPRNMLEEGWQTKAQLEMERSKRQGPFSLSKAPASATGGAPAAKKAKTVSKPSPSKLLHTSRGNGGKSSPSRKGQITSFFTSNATEQKHDGA